MTAHNGGVQHKELRGGNETSLADLGRSRTQRKPDKMPITRDRCCRAGGCSCSDGLCTCKDDLFHSWLSNTTIHGIVHVFTSKSPLRRIFWAIIFLSATGGCLYNIVDRFVNYLDRPTSTSVAFEANGGVQFPAITVCNLNQISLNHQLLSLQWVKIRQFGSG